MRRIKEHFREDDERIMHAYDICDEIIKMYKKKVGSTPSVEATINKI